MDYVALAKAKHMPDHPSPGAKMSGGDKIGDVNISWFITFAIYSNKTYRCSDKTPIISGVCGDGD